MSVGTGDPRASTAGSGTSSLSVVAGWVEMLHGQRDWPAVMEELRALSGCHRTVIARYRLDQRRARVAARSGGGAGPKGWSVGPRIYAPEILGNSAHSAMSGSIWQKSELTDEGHSELVKPHGGSDAAQLADAFVVILRSGRGSIDVLEFQFADVPLEHQKNLIVMLAPTLTETWRSRRPGLIEERLAKPGQRSVVARGTETAKDILDPSNPSRLSRCEFRVCMMVRRGHSAKGIADAFGVREATIRSHLSAIYAKTGVSGQLELLHLLAIGRPSVGLEDRASA